MFYAVLTQWSTPLIRVLRVVISVITVFMRVIRVVIGAITVDSVFCMLLLVL